MEIEEILRPEYIREFGMPSVLILNARPLSTRVFVDGKPIPRKCYGVQFKHTAGERAQLVCEFGRPSSEKALKSVPPLPKGGIVGDPIHGDPPGECPDTGIVAPIETITQVINGTLKRS